MGSFDCAQEDNVVSESVVNDNVVRARKCESELRAPDALLGIERGIHQRLLVFAGGMAVDGGRGLGAEVAVPGVVLQRAHAVFAASAGESHAAFDAIDGVVFHVLKCNASAKKPLAREWGGEGNAGVAEGVHCGKGVIPQGAPSAQELLLRRARGASCRSPRYAWLDSRGGCPYASFCTSSVICPGGCTSLGLRAGDRAAER